MIGKCSCTEKYSPQNVTLVHYVIIATNIQATCILWQNFIFELLRFALLHYALKRFSIAFYVNFLLHSSASEVYVFYLRPGSYCGKFVRNSLLH